MADDRKLLRVEIEVEVVERTRSDQGVRILLAVKTLQDLAPKLCELRIPLDVADDIDDATIDELCVNGVRHDILEAVGSWKPSGGRNTEPELQTTPRRDLADHAAILAELIEKHGATQRERHGETWLRTMLLSDLRNIYADGERNGYRQAADESKAIDSGGFD